MTKDWVIRVDTDFNLVKQLTTVKRGLLKGLYSIELSDGWPDTYLSEETISTWTSAAILHMLIRQGIFPNNYPTVVSKIIADRRETNGYTGWMMEKRFAPIISTYVTSDVLSLLLAIHAFDKIDDVIISLQNMQNKDGGWGVCIGDTHSKVKPTVWVLDALLHAFQQPFTQQSIDLKVLKNAIKWLYGAQNDTANDYGWGLLPESTPSCVSATSVTLSVLLYADFIDQNLGTKKDAIKRGIVTLKNLGENGFWKGDIEDFGITINGNFIARHTTGGLGTLAVINALILAVNCGYLPPNDYDLYLGITNLLSRCKSYPGYDGLWINPSDQAGPPIIWNSAYALDAISNLENYYLKLRRDYYIEDEIYSKIYSKAVIWRRIALALIVAILGVSLSLYLSRIGIATWFSSLSPLLQGFFFIVVTIIIEELYKRFLRPKIQELLKSEK